ncbi:MAG: hypothetical protein K8T90_22680 [Planctomycetes bacterium]|nr:hypothetical protein [Planctomycetota bacterium]
MSSFRALLRKESHDVRWIVWGCGLALGAIAFLVAYIVRARGIAISADAAVSMGRWAATLGGVLGGGAVAAELFAGDAVSGRVQTTALLPCGLGRTFAAKCLVTVAATLILGAWMAAWTPVAILAAGVPEAAGYALDETTRAPHTIAFALPIVATIALLAIVLEHGLGAILGGVVAAGAVTVSAGRFLPWAEWGFSVTPMTASIALAAVAGLLGGAAWIAFVHGPIHLGRRVRRAVYGAGSAVGALALCGFATATVGEARAKLAPGDSAAVIVSIAVSPDGTRAVLMVGNARVLENSYAWSVDLASGDVVVLPGHHRMFHSWDVAGGAPRVRLFEGERRSNGVFFERVDTIDVATAKVVATRSAEQIASEPTVDHWALVRKSTDGFVVEWPERGTKRVFDGANRVLVSPIAGRVAMFSPTAPAKVVDLATSKEWPLAGEHPSDPYTWTDGGRALRYQSWSMGASMDAVVLERWAARGEAPPPGRAQPTVHLLDADTGRDTVLAPPSGVWGLMSDGHHAVLHRTPGSHEIVDLRDGRTVAGPWTDGLTTFVRGSDRYAIRFATDAVPQLVDLTNGHVSDVHTGGDPFPANLFAPLADGALLAVGMNGSLDVIDGDARVVRRVLGPRAAAPAAR